MLGFLISCALLAVPMGGTVGVLMGIDYQRSLHGQTPLFYNGDGNNDNGGSSSGGGNSSGGGSTNNPYTNPTPNNTIILDNDTVMKQYCQTEVAVTPNSTGTEYTLNPNQWGWTQGTAGGLCMNITTFDNNTYATDTRAPHYSITWQYPEGPLTQPVHAFPYIQCDAKVLPAKLSTFSAINLELEWTYGVGTTIANKTNMTELTNKVNNVNTNVALDMFIDSDKVSSQNSSLAKYEIMVWFASIGNSTQPIGFGDGPVLNQSLQGTTFHLYTGNNSNSQTVMTWVAANTTEKFTGDIAPLVVRLSELNNASYPLDTDYLGYFTLGSEAFWSNKTVTMDVPLFSVDMELGATSSG